MISQVIIDTGPLVALINKGDQRHSWVTEEMANMVPPILTCESVVSETHFLLRRTPKGREGLAGLLEERFIQIPFFFGTEASMISKLLIQYQSVPISVADACLIRMAEIYSNSPVFTLDSDFQIYRKHGNQPVSHHT